MGGKVEGVGKLEEMGGEKVEGSERLKKGKLSKDIKKNTKLLHNINVLT